MEGWAQRHASQAGCPCTRRATMPHQHAKVAVPQHHAVCVHQVVRLGGACGGDRAASHFHVFTSLFQQDPLGQGRAACRRVVHGGSSGCTAGGMAQRPAAQQDHRQPTNRGSLPAQPAGLQQRTREAGEHVFEGVCAPHSQHNRLQLVVPARPGGGANGLRIGHACGERQRVERPAGPPAAAPCYPQGCAGSAARTMAACRHLIST